MLGHREAALPRRPRDRWATDVLLVGVTAVGGGVLWTAPFLCIVYTPMQPCTYILRLVFAASKAL